MFEYMAAGRTIVGDGFPTIHEVLTHGRDALLSDPDSFDDLRENLARALRMSHPNPIGEAAHKLASARFSWEARARGVLSSLQTSN
jgi:glycosyltransferase involved in cell wall biosynthesis